MIFPFLKYKQQTEPCIAQGPTIKQAVRWHASFKGSAFSIALPYSNKKGYEPDISPRGNYGTDNNKAMYSIRRWTSQWFANRQYRFWGPRGIGEVNHSTCAVGCLRIRDPKEGVSLFHPRAFEYSVFDYIEDRLTNYPEDEYLSLTPNTVRGPIDWQTFNHLPGPAAYFHIDTGTTSTLNHYFVTTLDDNDLFFVGFRMRPRRSGSKHIPKEEWVNMRNMKQLMFDIFNSVELTLSPEAESRRLKAIKDLKDTSLKKEMETQTFYTHPEKVKNAQPKPSLSPVNK